MKPDATEEAYERYHKEIYLYALSLCRDETLAEDLVSETFYKGFIASNRSEENFKYWLFRVLKNHFIDLKRKNHESLTLDTHDKFIPDKSMKEPAKNYIHKDRNQRLYKHLMTLEPEVYREILYLFYYGNLNIRAISKTIGRSESHTKTTLYRARKKLGKALKEDPYEF
ncbi:RNA polymerase subunit sigma [Alkalibacterium kapii]|uniref:RNA polymerase subunit sigma n=2 Tax=Alkalibacterium kapii TaxID=426704 RepID=A0A511ATZ0_9LACT|nr:RNA polymerase subunit sigma [Alkalibacterium kapii]